MKACFLIYKNKNVMPFFLWTERRGFMNCELWALLCDICFVVIRGIKCISYIGILIYHSIIDINVLKLFDEFDLSHIIVNYY